MRARAAGVPHPLFVCRRHAAALCGGASLSLLIRRHCQDSAQSVIIGVEMPTHARAPRYNAAAMSPRLPFRQKTQIVI